MQSEPAPTRRPRSSRAIISVAGIEAVDAEADEVGRAVGRMPVDPGARNVRLDPVPEPGGQRPLLAPRASAIVASEAESAAAIAAIPGVFSMPERRLRSRSSPHG